MNLRCSCQSGPSEVTTPAGRPHNQTEKHTSYAKELTVCVCTLHKAKKYFFFRLSDQKDVCENKRYLRHPILSQTKRIFWAISIFSTSIIYYTSRIKTNFYPWRPWAWWRRMSPWSWSASPRRPPSWRPPSRPPGGRPRRPSGAQGRPGTRGRTWPSSRGGPGQGPSPAGGSGPPGAGSGEKTGLKRPLV